MEKRKLLAISEPRRAMILTLACTLTYAASYVGRLNYSAALPYLLQTGILGRRQAGIISTAYFFTYGAGQLTSGMIADRTDPRIQVFVGSCGAALMNILMPMLHSFYLMLAVWTLNGCFQSMIWTPTLLLVASSVPERQKSKLLWILNTAPAIGAVSATLFSGFILQFLPWQSLFHGAFFVIFAGAGIFLFASRYAFTGATVRDAVIMDGNGMNETTASHSFLPLLAGSGAIMLIFPVMIHGMLKDGTTNWLPTFMSEYFTISAGMAVIISVIPQLISLLAATVAFWLEKHMRDEMQEAKLLFGGTAVCLCLMLLAGRCSWVFTILLFALVIMSMQAVNVVFVSQMPSHFVRYGRMATVSGFFNCVGYIGCALSMYLIALISDLSGWQVTLAVWFGCAAAGLVLIAVAGRRWREFIKKEKEETGC